MASDPDVGKKPQRSLMVGAAIGLVVAILLVAYFAVNARKEEKDLKPVQAPLATQN